MRYLHHKSPRSRCRPARWCVWRRSACRRSAGTAESQHLISVCRGGRWPRLGHGLAHNPVRGPYSHRMGQLGRALARRREGLGLLSQVGARAGLKVRPRFAGVLLSAPDESTAWTVVSQIAGGEYRWPGLTPESGWRVVDVGANIGVFSLWAERLGATVAAFEPEPHTFASLIENTRDKRIEPVQAALIGDGASVARLYLSDIRSTRHTLTGKEIESGRPLTDFVEVPALSLGEIVGDGCDLLKLDCEGAEFDAILRTDDDVLRRARRIVVEFHRVAGDPSLLTARLAEAGMQASVLSTAEDGSVGVIGAEYSLSPRNGG